MNHKNLLNRSLVLFFVIILAVPVFWVARGKIEPQQSSMEYRTLNVFPSLETNNFKMSAKRLLQGKFSKAYEKLIEQYKDFTFQDAFQQAVMDQMPFRSTAVQLAKNVTRLSIKAAYLPTGDEIIPADNRISTYEILSEKALIPRPLSFSAKDKEIIDEKIANYESAVKLHQNQNFYGFYIDVIERSAVNPLKFLTFGADAQRGFRYFLKNKPDELIVESLLHTDLDDHTKYFYNTDHHWNVHGMLLGYEKVYQMLAQNYPDITPMLQHETIYTFPDIEFHGSWARAVFYQIHPGDPFEVVLLNLPPYKIYDLAGNEIDYNNKDEYLAGNYSRAPFTDHYIEYNGKDVDFLEYVFENGTERNLLIIGDSFSNSIEPLLAAHYHHTYAVDIRHWPDYYFSLSDFFSMYDVDDILVLGGPASVMYQYRWTILP